MQRHSTTTTTLLCQTIPIPRHYSINRLPPAQLFHHRSSVRVLCCCYHFVFHDPSERLGKIFALFIVAPHSKLDLTQSLVPSL